MNKNYKILLMLFMFFITAGLAQAETYTSGDFNYEVDRTNGTLTVTGMTSTAKSTASRNFLLNGVTYSLSLPEALFVDGLGTPAFAVTEVADNAFSNLPFLGSVTLHSAITRVGVGAFSNNTSLTTVVTKADFLESDAFANCSNLSDLDLDEGTGYLEEGAFENCTSLLYVGIPLTLRGMNAPNVFAGCTNLKRFAVSFDHTVYSQVDGILYSKDKSTLLYCPEAHTTYYYSLADETTIIASQAFRNNQYTGTLVLPDGVTSLNPYAFYNAALSTIVLGSNVNVMGNKCLADCPNLAKIIILNDEVPATTTDAFTGLTSTTAYVPDNAESFYQSNSTWSALTLRPFCNADVEESLFNYSYVENTADGNDQAFVTGLSDYSLNIIANGSMFSRLEIPICVYHNERMYDVTELTERAFFNQSGIMKVVIFDNIKRVGNYALFNCKDLGSIEVAAEVIGESAITSNSNLTSLILNPGVKILMTDAMRWNSRLKEVELPSTVTYVSNTSFSQDSLMNITVASGNANYTSENGVLFDSQKKTLVRFPSSNTAHSGELPTTLTKIADNACHGLHRNYLILPDGVTEIGFEAFRSSDLATFKMGSNVQTIGKGAFKYCNDLTSFLSHTIVPPAADSAFVNLDQSSIYLLVPKGSVEAYSTDDNWKDFNITGYYDADAEDAILAFSLDSEGKAIVTGFSQYGKSLINDGTVFDLVEIPNIIYFNGDINNVRSLGSDAFRNQRGFKGMLISGFVNSIGSWALNGCSDLETLYIGSKTLNSYSVTNNPKLSNLILYEGVESTVNGALGNNPMLTSVHLPASFASLDAGSLINASLENITVESGNESYVSLQGALFDKNKTTLVRWPASNTTFTGVFMPSVKAIARNGCMYLKRNKVILSDYITTLGMMSFYGAEIESVVLGSGVETVAIQAFSGCENLSSIECHAVTPPSANSAFYGLDKPSITLSVPAESIAAYKAADEWKDFFIRPIGGGVYGDVNGDGEVTSVDITAVYNVILGTSDEFAATADVDGDGQVTAVDVTIIYNILLGN